MSFLCKTCKVNYETETFHIAWPTANWHLICVGCVGLHPSSMYPFASSRGNKLVASWIQILLRLLSPMPTDGAGAKDELSPKKSISPVGRRESTSLHPFPFSDTVVVVKWIINSTEVNYFPQDLYLWSHRLSLGFGGSVGRERERVEWHASRVPTIVLVSECHCSCSRGKVLDHSVPKSEAFFGLAIFFSAVISDSRSSILRKKSSVRPGREFAKEFVAMKSGTC